MNNILKSIVINKDKTYKNNVKFPEYLEIDLLNYTKVNQHINSLWQQYKAIGANVYMNECNYTIAIKKYYGIDIFYHATDNALSIIVKKNKKEALSINTINNGEEGTITIDYLYSIAKVTNNNNNHGNVYLDIFDNLDITIAEYDRNSLLIGLYSKINNGE